MNALIHRLCRALTGAVLAFGLVQPALAQGWQANSDDALLFDVRLGQYRLGDGVRGYAVPGGTCVDLADVIMALDLPIRLDKKLRRATGWAFEERRNLLIDREARAVQIMNKSEVLRDGDLFDTPEGWCVNAARLSAWLGVRLTPDLGNALLVVQADSKLPVEMAAERRARAARVRPVSSFDLKSLPQASLPFRGIKPPSVDAVVSLGGLREARRGGQQLNLGYELYAAGEIGPLAYDARLSSNQRGVPESLRLRAYRSDPQARLLGPLRATHVALGDVAGLATPLVAQAGMGRGALLTNRPIERPDSFDRTNFRGELPSGWDAELYRNGQLLAFAGDRADGRYEFLDVPLLYGQNRFEIILYGPQGQVRRDERTVPVGLDSIPPRRTYYWAGINEEGHDLIGVGAATRAGLGGWRGSFGVERGINAKTSVSAFAHSLIGEDGDRRNFGEVALRRAIGPALGEISASASSRGGYALRAQMLGEFGKTYVTGESIVARGGFDSDRILKGVSSIHRISVDQGLRLGRSLLPLHLESRYTRRTDGSAVLESDARVSTNIGRMSLTGQLDWRDDRRRFGPDPPGELFASALANARIGRVRLRGESRFRLTGGARFESTTLVGEWAGKASESDRRGQSWRAEIGYDGPLKRARAAIGHVRRYDKVSLTVSAEAASDGALAAGLNLAFSIGPDPRGGIRMSAERLAAQGQALVEVWRDFNGDGVRQSDEPLEPNVQVAAGRAPVAGLTNRAGQVLVDGLEPYQPLLIGVDAASLPDPFVQPANQGMVVLPRPGVAAHVRLALVSAGEVDGTLIRAGGGALEGVDLELIAVDGRVAARTRSDFDGFFLFESVPYGRYTLRVAALSAAAAKLDPQLGGVALVGARSPLAHLGMVAAAPRVRAAASDTDMRVDASGT